MQLCGEVSGQCLADSCEQYHAAFLMSVWDHSGRVSGLILKQLKSLKEEEGSSTVVTYCYYTAIWLKMMLAGLPTCTHPLPLCPFRLQIPLFSVRVRAQETLRGCPLNSMLV